ncbi:MAG: hypothetical protein JW833_05605 [Prolixibacteraceae bacterium]|nr:hypothetical protein [Prolixibacteraceae bacterium]
MKTKIIIMLVSFFLPAFLMAQQKENKDKKDPDEQITINKEYDEEGNLIRYDSTYTFEWHSDTMMVFPQGGGSFFAPDIFSGPNDLISKFFSDSLFHISPFRNEWNEDFFKGHEDFFKQFNNPFFDEEFFGNYTWKGDSLNNFQWNDSTFVNPFSDHFNFPGMSEFFKNYKGLQNFENTVQQKEWEEIIKRYQKEMDEFNKKWDSKNKEKPKSDIKQQRL